MREMGTMNDNVVDLAEVRKALEAAYIYLLQTDGYLRVKNQWTFVLVRESIAALAGRSEHETQDYFEAKVSLATRVNQRKYLIEINGGCVEGYADKGLGAEYFHTDVEILGELEQELKDLDAEWEKKKQV